MAIRTVYTYGAPVLRKKADPVDEPLDGLRHLVDDMFETMYAEPGIGLAAPQVGVSKRLVVLASVPDRDDDEESMSPPLVLVNPEIVDFSSDRAPYEEGCLSVPGITEVVERASRIEFRYTDLDGRTQQRAAAELLARVIQHEVDHLDGILFVDRLSLLKRQLLRKRLQRMAETSGT